MKVVYTMRLLNELCDRSVFYLFKSSQIQMAYEIIQFFHGFYLVGSTFEHCKLYTLSVDLCSLIQKFVIVLCLFYFLALYFSVPDAVR